MNSKSIGSYCFFLDVIYWLETVAKRQLPAEMAFQLLEPFLEASLSRISLEKNAEGQWQQVRCHKQDTVKQLLGPATETAAHLTKVDSTLVRVCEHEECILWFSVRTKTHKRRWCSIALYGNRYKVAKHRK